MLRSLVAASALVCSVVAQQFALPEHSYFAASGQTGNLWRATEFRCQNVYDAQDFVDHGANGPLTITRLRWRAADNAQNGGGASYQNVHVRLSSCPLDYTAASTTFAQNRGADEVLCYSGAVTLQRATGGAPNAWIVDIALQTPFVWNPTLGADLCVEVDAPAPTGINGVPLFASCSGQVGERARRVATGSLTAAAGTTSPFAAALLIDASGGGGYASWGRASSTNQGVGCYAVARSCYESFASANAFDLANSTLLLTPNAGGGYDVAIAPATPFFAHGAVGLGLGDEAVVQQTLPAAFGASLPFPGSSATVLGICSNGYVWLGSDLGAAPVPDVAALLQGTPRLAPFWADLLPDAQHDVYFDVDPAGNTVYATWDAVPTFELGGEVSVQVALHSSGAIEYRYGNVIGVPSTPVLTGWSPGLGAVDPGQRDLDVAAPFATAGPDRFPLQLDATVPLLGGTVTHTIRNVPPSALLSVRLCGVTPRPGIDLGSAGAPGCALWVDNNNASATLLFGAPVATATLTVPNIAAFVGITMITQAASLVPGVNALGLLTSNQNVLVVGNG